MDLDEILSGTIVQEIKVSRTNISNDICQIIFEGESTNIGREVTIDRIKEAVKYNQWLDND